MEWTSIIEVALMVTATLVGLIVWFVRLEGKVKYLERESLSLSKTLNNIQEHQNVIEGEISKELRQIQVDLAQIKGFLMRKSESEP